MTRETEELLSAFARLSGMHLSVYDRDFHTIFSPSPLSPDHFCAVLHRKQETLAPCIASDLSARRACLKSGRLYAYRCPFGLFEAIVPIYVCGELNGFLIAGKSLPSGAEDTVLDTALPYAEEEHHALLKEAVRALSRHTEQEYEDLCRLLEMLGEHLAAKGGFSYETETIPVAVRRYLQRSYRLPITLAELSMNFHCSTVSLTKWYYREYGKTIMEDLAEIRMEKAKRMLADSSASVSSIADACGFPDSGYFSKRFRKHTGLSPTEWREQASSSTPIVAK